MNRDHGPRPDESESRGEVRPEDLRGWRRTVVEVRRHVEWGRTEGWSRLVEEDRLDVADRVRVARRRRRWRRENAVAPGEACPIWVVGLQRSGTNMVVRGFESHGAFEVYGESDRRAFDNYLLRPGEEIGRLIDASRHRYIMFKPLCDSHRVGELIDRQFGSTPGRALWIHRSVHGRARSAVSKFGSANRSVLSEIAQGGARDRWQAQGLSEGALELIDRFDPPSLTPHAAAALFWLVRNQILFEKELDRRSDLAVVSYERLVAHPADTMTEICSFLGLAPDPQLWAHVDQRALRPEPVELPEDLARLTDELTERLAAASLGPAVGRR